MGWGRHNASSMPKIATAGAVQAALAQSGELALLDVREQGVHYRGHPFFACSAPLSRLELVVGDLVPRRTAPVVVLDGGAEGLADKRRRAARGPGLCRRCRTRRRLRRLEGRGGRALQRRQRALEGVRRVRRAPLRHPEDRARRAEAPQGTEAEAGHPRFPSVRGIPPHEHPGRDRRARAPSSSGACTISLRTRTPSWW